MSLAASARVRSRFDKRSGVMRDRHKRGRRPRGLTRKRLQAWRRINVQAADDQLLLTKDELAKRLRLTRRGVEGLVSAKKIPVIRISRQIVRFSWPRVQAALHKLEEQAI